MKLMIEIKNNIFPPSNDKNGVIVTLLFLLTIATGLVDAYSYLVLDRVFVASITGNVIFLGISLAGVTDFSALSSLIALASFSMGAIIGGRMCRLITSHRLKLLMWSSIAESILFSIALFVAFIAGEHISQVFRFSLIFLMATAMGLQNAIARKLAVPDLMTTVLTVTIVALSVDSKIAGGNGIGNIRRVLSITTMLLGGLIGTVFIVHINSNLTILCVLILTIVVAVVSFISYLREIKNEANK